jgi:hypothetical protein
MMCMISTLKKFYATFKQALLGYETGLETYCKNEYHDNWEFAVNYFKRHKKFPY